MSKSSSPKPPAAIARRLEACRSKIQDKRADGYLVTSRADQFYLTGFNGEDGGALILPRKVYLLTDGRFKEEAADARWATAVFRKGPFSDVVAKLVRKHRITRLGIQPEHLTVLAHQRLRAAVKPARLVGMPSVAGDLRQIKDKGEVAAIAEAVRVAEAGFRAAIKRIRIGMTEQQFAAILRYEMIARGASDASFPIIVAEGPNSSRPHAVPGNRKFKRGSVVLIDWGATVNHYRSDLTRVVFIRRIPPRFRQVYERVLEAQLAGIDAIRPGVLMSDVDSAARSVLKRAGMDKAFSHSLGHGIGIDIHEEPRLAPKVDKPLEPGMVVTVEPGVYFSGKPGVRIEDDVLVTRTGHEVLSRLTRDIERMIV